MTFARLKKHAVGRRPKSQKSSADTRMVILRSARKAFARHGFEGTSMREVAKAARVNNAMIYYHFKDKTELYRSVIADSFDALSAIWKDDLFRSAVSVRTKVQGFIERYILFQQRNEDLRRILAMEFAGSGGNICWSCEQYFTESYRMLGVLLQEGMRTGELRRFDIGLAIPSLIGMIVHNFIMLPYAESMRKKKVDLSARTFGRFVSDLFFDGLGTGLRKPAVGQGTRRDRR